MADVEAAIQEMFQAPHIQVSLKFSLYVNIELWLNCYWHLYSICLNDNMLEEDIKLINEACNILIVMSCYKANYMWINVLSKQYYAERRNYWDNRILFRELSLLFWSCETWCHLEFLWTNISATLIKNCNSQQ